jgi:hypothetical protein
VQRATSEQELLAAAEARTGLSDWGDDWFRRPLAAWVEDLQSDHLNDAGRSFFTALAVRDLSRRLRVIDTLRRNPEIDDVTIPPIAYITGTVRSGTTLFHNAMSRHARAKALLRWELMEPVPPPERATADTDPRIAEVQVSIDKRRGTPLEAMHWVNADEPEECQWGFIDFVSLLAGAAGGCMLRWAEFVFSADYTAVFENYRRLVKLLIWRNPPPDGGFLVLKAPQVASHVEEFSSVFPEARFVVTARDPYRVFASGRAMVGGIVDAFITDDRAVVAVLGRFPRRLTRAGDDRRLPAAGGRSGVDRGRVLPAARIARRSIADARGRRVPRRAAKRRAGSSARSSARTRPDPRRGPRATDRLGVL